MTVIFWKTLRIAGILVVGLFIMADTASAPTGPNEANAQNAPSNVAAGGRLESQRAGARTGGRLELLDPSHGLQLRAGGHHIPGDGQQSFSGETWSPVSSAQIGRASCRERVFGYV